MARHRRRVSGTFIASAVAAGLVLAAARAHAHPAGGDAAGGTQASAGSVVALGQQLASGYGWGTGAEWICLDELWTRESGWQMVWNYAGSGAYGIPQALPASKMASAGADYMTDPATQIRWGLGYIRGTYGDPCTAWAHETASGWY
jgi:resuscitation-promoting factor RpfB